MKQFKLFTFLLIPVATSIVTTINISYAAGQTNTGETSSNSETDTIKNKETNAASGAGATTKKEKSSSNEADTTKNKETNAASGTGTTERIGAVNGKADNTIGFIGLGLGILNIIGLGLLFWLNKKDINKIREKARSSEQRIDSLKSKHQLLDTHVKKVEGDLQNSSGKTNKEIERLRLSVEEVSRKSASIQQSASVPQSNHRAERYPSPSERYNSTSVSTQLSPTDYYNNHQHDFQNKYQITAVGRETENFNKSRAAQTDLVILAGDQQGNYWLFSDSSELYIVPKQNLKITGSRINNTRDLFECQDYNEQNYDNFTLVKPAVVVSQGDGTWKLTHKGELQFG